MRAGELAWRSGRPRDLASALLVSGVLVGGAACSRWGGSGPTDPVLELPAPTFPKNAMPPGAAWTRESVHPNEWDIPKDLGKLYDTFSIEASFDSGKARVAVEDDGPVTIQQRRRSRPVLARM